MKNVPLVAKIGFLVFCIALAVLLITRVITICDSSFLFAVGLFAFGIIRIFKEKKRND
jgi:hypothetical protein